MRSSQFWGSCVQVNLIQRVDAVGVGSEDIFKGIGCLKWYVYDIDLKDNPQLPICSTRRVPHALRAKVRQELDLMTKQGIAPITEPTPEVSPMIVIQRGNKLRICIDPSEINKNLKRRHYPLSTLEEISARISGSQWFTILDCRKGFWQIRVTDRTSKYLTFSTPFGRYCCKRLPFGLASAPEVFQQIICNLLDNIQGVESSVDDILIHAATREELEEITKKVITKLMEAGLKLNLEKCEFAKNKNSFLGNLLTGQGLLQE